MPIPGTKQIKFYGETLTVLEETPVLIFRGITSEEEGEFIGYARTLGLGVTVDYLWHPVLQNYLLTTQRGHPPAIRIKGFKKGEI